MPAELAAKGIDQFRERMYRYLRECVAVCSARHMVVESKGRLGYNARPVVRRYLFIQRHLGMAGNYTLVHVGVPARVRLTGGRT